MREEKPTRQTEPLFLQTVKLAGKLWVIVTAVLGSLFIFGIAAIIIFWRHEGPEIPQPPTQKIIQQNGKDKVAVIHLTGEIIENGESVGFGSPANIVTARDTVRLLSEVSKQDDIKAVILVINSPGGEVVASDEIYQAVRKLREKKPVVVQMLDLAASGGYYIAAGANTIVANPATITGSIGVIAQFPKLAGLYDKLGVQMRTVKSGQFKDIGSADRDFTPEETKILQSMIGEAYDQFVKSISVGRNMDEQRVRQLADGRIYTGHQAKENGLVDQLGGFDTAVEQAESMAHISHATIVEFSSESFWQSLFSAKVNNLLPLSSLQNILSAQKTGMFYLLQI